jgi:hypothetical protein
MKYGITVWGNSSNRKMIFMLQKQTVSIFMEGINPRIHTKSFKRLRILPLSCEYIFSIMNYIVNNKEHIWTNSAVHSVNTRNRQHVHRPTANLSCFQKGAYYAGIKTFDNLPSSLKILMNEKAQFKAALKSYIHNHSTLLMNSYYVKMTHSLLKHISITIAVSDFLNNLQ